MEMLLGSMTEMLIASRYVLFENGDKIGEYRSLEDIPEEYKKAYVIRIMTPFSTAFHNVAGDMFIDIKFGNF